MNASKSIIDYIKQREGFRAKAYKDGSKYAIGYGHQIKTTEASLKTAVVSLEWANTTLLKDIQPLENQLNKCSKPPKGQAMFDALLDFGFNCGGGALQNALNNWIKGDSSTLCEYLLKYKYYTNDSGQKVVSNELVSRREYEVNLIKTGSSSSSTPIFAFAVLGLAWFFLKR